MQAIEYTTNVSPTGHFLLPPEILEKLHLKQKSKIKFLLLYEEETEKKGLNRFCGKWQDDKNPDEIINEIYESRSKNYRSEGSRL